MNNKRLGKLKKAELRSIWPNEEKDFSSWLAEEENLTFLGEELGLEISLIGTEAGVGRYSLDILAEEEGTGKKIIIENQLENTNHDHLGKIITYAAGHDAPIVIWVFKDIREEHRQAIDWLNENTNEEISFFAVKIEAWQIDESVPAPKFQIISKPNEWSKTIRKSSGSKEASDTELKQLDFWANLKNYSENKGLNIFTQTPKPRHWYNFSIGTSEAHGVLRANTKENELSCEIYISKNKELYNFLNGMKGTIETEIGATLEWIEANIAARIVQRMPNFDLDSDDSIENDFDWLIDRATIFQKVFAKLIKQYKNQI